MRRPSRPPRGMCAEFLRSYRGGGFAEPAPLTVILGAGARQIHKLFRVCALIGPMRSTRGGGLPNPQASPGLARLLFVDAELLEIPERVLHVGVAVALLDDLRVDEGAVGEEHVRQRSLVAVRALMVELQPNDLALCHPARELARLVAEELYRLSRIDRLRRVYTNQPNRADALDDNRVSVHNPGDKLSRRARHRKQESQYTQ